MQLLEDGTVVVSASDLTAASACEWALMRSLDAKLGRDVTVPVVEDAMLARAGGLGDAHERRVLAELEQTLGTAVTIERPEYGASTANDWRERMATATGATIAALTAGAPLVFQGAFFDGEFQGFADFLVRSGADAAGRPIYEVYDTKLARHAKIPALLQLAAYVDQLRKAGVLASDTVRLILGDRSESVHDVGDILPVYLHRRERLRDLVRGRIADDTPTPWNDQRYSACGRCAACAEQVAEHRDVLLVAGMKLTQRAKLRAAGVETIDQLAAAASDLDTGIPARTLAKMRAQASIQLPTVDDPHAAPGFVVFDASTLRAIPPSDAGDLFFDFEGDPLYEEKGRWGLDYLFGVYGRSVDPTGDDPEFRTFWAENLAEERTALIEFLEFVRQRRATHPHMHIYHYASYEKTHLLSIAARHGVGEDEVDDLLRGRVLIDLYPVVLRSVRIGSHSYSIKKLEPLYMGTEKRSGIANAADSVEQFAEYAVARDVGDATAATLRADIIQYNRYDCRSTLKLRDWLIGLAIGEDVTPSTVAIAEREAPLPDPTHLALTALIAEVPVEDRTELQTAIALAAAAIDYHRREDKKFWQEHFARLAEPDESVWGETRGVMTLEPDQVTVVEEWQSKPRSQPFRVLRLAGTVAPGSTFGLIDTPFLVYDEPHPPVPAVPPLTDPAMRLAHSRVEVLEVTDDASLLVKERLGKGGSEHDLLPVALTPPAPFRVTAQKDAIRGWGEKVLRALGECDVHDPPHDRDRAHDHGHDEVRDPSFDILRRIPPRGILHPVGEGMTSDAIVETLRGIDRSYVAVQGPPGSGKTFTGSHVIARLVSEFGWKVGVVAQSHSTVQTVLEAVLDRGLPKHQVGKRPKKGDTEPERPWTILNDTDVPAFVSADGFVFGGTAWDFCNPARITPDSLDLLVIDEAGQYSLANTIAVSVAAKRLLLLGDPQQLPQVTVGAHPEPIDMSALGWLSLGHDVLPAQLGYFLPESWRMHPAVCAPVSRLSYAGELRSASGPDAPQRELAGVEPGLHAIGVAHSGNATESIEEADAVVALVGNLLGRAWTEGGATAPLGQNGVIVVAAYNSQVNLIRSRLDAGGLLDVRVGTVDKFQGAEAPVSIVSLAASSAADVPRGIEFLLMPNRLNVAISRAKWAAYLVHSPALADHLPTNIGSLSLLGKYLRLLGDARPLE